MIKTTVYDYRVGEILTDRPTSTIYHPVLKKKIYIYFIGNSNFKFFQELAKLLGDITRDLYGSMVTSPMSDRRNLFGDFFQFITRKLVIENILLKIKKSKKAINIYKE